MKFRSILSLTLALAASSVMAQNSGLAGRIAGDLEAAVGGLVRGIPSDAMGQCNDGTFTKAPRKADACAGNQGLKIWYSDNNAGRVEPPASSARNSSRDPDAAVGEPVRGIPSDATAKCRDGTFSKAGKKENACTQHNGVAIWYPG